MLSPLLNLGASASVRVQIREIECTLNSIRRDGSILAAKLLDFEIWVKGLVNVVFVN